MIKCIKFLFCIIIIATSCSDSVFEEDQIELQNDHDENINLRLPCSQIDYVLVGVNIQGPVEEACQNGICAAYYDLQNHYETYTVTRRVRKETFTGEGDTGVTNQPTSVTITKLTNESYNNYLSYLTTLEDNITGNDPVNDEYWATFIACYKNIINP